MILILVEVVLILAGTLSVTIQQLLSYTTFGSYITFRHM